jgi:hypothetical protein
MNVCPCPYDDGVIEWRRNSVVYYRRPVWQQVETMALKDLTASSRPYHLLTKVTHNICMPNSPAVAMVGTVGDRSALLELCEEKEGSSDWLNFV